MGYKIFFIMVAGLALTLATCPRFPQVSVDHQVHLTVLGEPKLFVPSSLYPVQLHSSLPFREFMLTCEADSWEGSFQILDISQTTFADDCVNTVVENNQEVKQLVHVLWTAPQSGCVNIKGAVRIREGWISVNKSLCVLDTMQSISSQSVDCCACDHAKYKIVFEGLWSPHTHPKDFPTTLWLTHFSDVIGATHTPTFTMWAEGQIATYGFKQLAEYGVVRELETELRNQSTQLRSIIKASGLWHPNLNGKTTAIFRVDPRRHLLSLASMFGPSPDWIVGVSSLNLCLTNCTWLEDKTLDLYPYDAGTDNGITYMSINSPTEPPEKIHPISTMYPEDPRAPFYDPSRKEMLPLARLYITREDLIPKKCSDLTEAEILEQVSLTENTEEEVRPECGVTPYSVWTPCSVTCGKGLRMRTREYVNQMKAKMFSCDRQLISKEMCVSQQPSCPGDTDEEEVVALAEPGECDVSGWSEWSDCSVTCGIGFIVRTRTFTMSEGQVHKKCMHISTMEKEKCMLPPCSLQEPKVSPACQVNGWSDWSPCSVTCGKGQRVRVRSFVSPNPPKFCAAITQTSQTHPCSYNKSCTIDLSESKNICTLASVAGPCRGSFLKWTFHYETGLCTPFYYGGCRGNKNRFDTAEECNSTCGSFNVEQIKSKINFVDGQEHIPSNCIVSKWSNWSRCHPCTNGTRTKTRTIISNPTNGGRPCPLLSRTINCSIPEEICPLLY